MRGSAPRSPHRPADPRWTRCRRSAPAPLATHDRSSHTNTDRASRPRSPERKRRERTGYSASCRPRRTVAIVACGAVHDGVRAMGASNHGGCGVVLVRTRSSHPWALGRRHPWRRMVLTNTTPHPPLTSLHRSIEGSLNARLRAFILCRTKASYPDVEVTADRCGGASGAMDGPGRATTDGSSDPVAPISRYQPARYHSTMHAIFRNTSWHRRSRLHVIGSPGSALGSCGWWRGCRCACNSRWVARSVRWVIVSRARVGTLRLPTSRCVFRNWTPPRATRWCARSLRPQVSGRSRPRSPGSATLRACASA